MDNLFPYLQDAIGGPGTLRFIIQPVLAILLGVRDGRRDSKAGVAPFLYKVFSSHGERGRILVQEGLKKVVVPLCIGFVLDIVLRFYLGFGFHPLASAAVGTTLVGLPYVIARSITNRLLKRRV